MRKLFTVLIVLLLISCSTPLDKKYNEANFESDAKEIKESGKLSEEEAKLMVGYILKAKLRGENIEGKSYNEIIQTAKDFKKEQLQLAEKSRIEEENKRQKLSSALTVAMYDKGYDKYDYQDYLTYSFVFKNKTDKEIRAFKGSVSIQDLFDTEIKVINLIVDDAINSGETVRKTYTSDYNQFKDEDSRLRNKDMEDLKIIWTPEKIIFADGSTLE
ncbi:hypothetical protein JAO71_08550 [Olleya sp. YSTF-M6]|uniref:Lipoprotein n=1 Tax=Olleya sediminilitoris TaxID=2795739 RepID=A0ABS1WL52_9FLAO|nr:hypothetical protein [Olleya sediminilitoris]MBL7559850.1 hypothetical protein [Olleya sediminilitoris]